MEILCISLLANPDRLHSHIEMTILDALRLRNNKISYYYCGGLDGTCDNIPPNGDKNFCISCHQKAYSRIKDFGFNPKILLENETDEEREIAAKRTEINELIEQIRPENERFILIKICLIGAYIKRVSNIILLDEIYGYVSSLELENAIIESLLNYRIKNEVSCEDKLVDFKLSGLMAKKIYSCFSRELERSLEKNIRVDVSWSIEKDVFMLSLSFIGEPSEIKGVFSFLDEWNDLGEDVLREHGKNLEKISISIRRYI